MSVATPLGWLALLAVPAIVAVYVFQRRRPERRTSSLMLWPVRAVAASAGRQPRWLRAPLSLWLECLAAVSLAAWLAGVDVRTMVPRHVVLVVDGSASMAAVSTAERVERALQAVRAGLVASDAVTLVVSGVEPEVLLGPAVAAAALPAALPRPRALSPDHALGPAIDLGRQLGGQGCELLLVTDHEPADVGADVRVIACGVAASNLAIGGVQRVPATSAGAPSRLLVDLFGAGATGAGRLLASVSGRQVAAVAIAAAAEGAVQQVSLQLPPGAADDVVRLQLEVPGDGLALDDVAHVLPAVQRTVAICDRLPPQLRRGFEIERVLQVQSGWRREADPQRAQLLLCGPKDKERAVAASGQWQLLLGQSEGAPHDRPGPFVIDRSHPLLSGVELRGVAVRSGAGVIDFDRALVLAGNDVLVAERRRGQVRQLRIDVDPESGNLVRSWDWPILFANVLEAARAFAPGLQVAELGCGDELVYRAVPGAPAPRLLGPDGETLEVLTDDAMPGVLRVRLFRPGRYRIVAADGVELASAAVRFVDRRESDLTGLCSFDRAAPMPPGTKAAADSGVIPKLLLLSVLLLLGADWWWLSRRSA